MSVNGAAEYFVKPVPWLEGLKPCPFCGGTHHYADTVLIDEEECHFVVCKTCGCEGPNSSLPECSRMLWDIRQVAA